MPDEPYSWNERSVIKILKRMEYIDCTANFKTYRKSHRPKKNLDNRKENWAVFYDTQAPIIPREQWERVQELSKTYAGTPKPRLEFLNAAKLAATRLKCPKMIRGLSAPRQGSQKIRRFFDNKEEQGSGRMFVCTQKKRSKACFAPMW